MAHEVPALPYDYAALEAAIDEQTMRIHHDKHHQAYVDNLNAALAGTDWADTPIEELLQNLDSLPEDKRTPVRNNGGGHYNHTLFWQWMSPDGGGDPPDGPLKDAIEQAFGDVASLKAQMNDAGVKRFGSGWSWLVAAPTAGSRRRVDTEPGHAAAGGPNADPRDRRLGARLLPSVPEPPPGLPRRLVGRRELGRRSGSALAASARNRNPASRVETGNVATFALQGALPPAVGSARIRAVTEHDLTDSELLLRVGHGDRGAFEPLYRRYARPVFGLALRRLGDRSARRRGRPGDVHVGLALRSQLQARARPGRTVALRRRAERDRRPRARPHRSRRRRPARRAFARAGPARAGRAELALVARPPRARGAAGARARRPRARLLEGSVAERDRRTPRHSARYREDAHAQQPRPARAPAGGRVL